MWLTGLSILFLTTDIISGNELTGNFKLSIENYEDDKIYKSYQHLDEIIKTASSTGLKMILPYVMDMQMNGLMNISSTCQRDVFTLLSELRKLKISALKFVDATGKPSDGILDGNMHMAGDYDQCLSSTVQRKNGSIAFRGQYCMLHIRLPLAEKKLDKNSKTLNKNYGNFSEVIQFISSMSKVVYAVPVKFGLCAPSGCTPSDIEQVAKYVAESLSVHASLQYCNVAESTQFPPGRIVAICLFSFFGLLLLIGSLLDHYSKMFDLKLEGFGSKFLLSFSALRNFPKVMDTNTEDHTLTCLSGIRVLSLFYVIFEHQYYFLTETCFENHLFQKIEDYKSFFMQIIINGLLTTDVFFFIGGLSNCYARMKNNDSSKRNISVLQIIVHRLWRLYPTYIVSILTIYLFYDGYGPNSTFFREHYIEKCDTNWWKNLIFIDNFFDQKDNCLIQSWYIAADMHLFLLSLLIIPVFFRNATRGISMTIAAILTGIISTVVLAWYKDIIPALIINDMDHLEIQKFRNTYVNTLPHIAPYFIGVAVGYILYKKRNIKISKVILFIGWISASLLFLSMLFISQRWNMGINYSKAESYFYFAFSRPLYILAVAWMVLCCATGHGGIINYILSLKIWIPLARISYMAYLISPIVQLFYEANLRRPPDNHVMITVWKHAGDVTISCLLSLVMVVAFESPFIALEKLLFQQKKPREEESNNEISKSAADKSAFRSNIDNIKLENQNDKNIRI